jgi:alanyl-tRNA synthetase
VVVIANEADGKVGLLVAVSKDLTSKVQAGAVVREIAPIVGGGGGGRPDSPKPAAGSVADRRGAGGRAERC